MDIVVAIFLHVFSKMERRRALTSNQKLVAVFNINIYILIMLWGARLISHTLLNCTAAHKLDRSTEGYFLLPKGLELRGFLFKLKRIKHPICKSTSCNSFKKIQNSSETNRNQPFKLNHVQSSHDPFSPEI